MQATNTLPKLPMAHKGVDIDWLQALPAEYHTQVIVPAQIDYFHDRPANAEKWRGYDATGAACYYQHSFLLQEEGFDCDEFPLLIDVYYECVHAWRLQQGGWLKVTTVSDRLDLCHHRFKTQPPVWVASL